MQPQRRPHAQRTWRVGAQPDPGTVVTMSLARRSGMIGRVLRAAGRPPLIFVLGSQRSGTNVLRQSLSLDPWVRGFNEHPSNRLYQDWKLRPEPEIRGFLRRQPGTVLLKPIRSVIDRPVGEFLAEFAAYRYTVAWIYRDPVLVFASRRKRWSYLDDVDRFVEEWNRINRSALDARDERMVVVRYGDLTASRDLFAALCGRLGVHGEYLFRGDAGRGHADVAAADVERIRSATARTCADLDRARGFVPSVT
jgi:hypothetical protein